MSCLFHRWSKWVPYEERGRVLTRKGWEDYVEVRQSRRCARCGKTNDEFIKAGPMAVNNRLADGMGIGTRWEL